jgi:hypothetical protein
MVYSFCDSSPISPVTGSPPAGTAAPRRRRRPRGTRVQRRLELGPLVVDLGDHDRARMPTAAHSSHSILVTPSIPSVAETANSAESPRGPGPEVPVKSA